MKILCNAFHELEITEWVVVKFIRAMIWAAMNVTFTLRFFTHGASWLPDPAYREVLALII